MDAQQEIDLVATQRAVRPKPWQFSLRTIFILTLVCAGCFAIAAQFPAGLTIALGVASIIGVALLIQVLAIFFCIGITVTAEFIAARLLIGKKRFSNWLAGKRELPDRK